MFVTHPQILIFSVFKIANLTSYCIANKIFHVTDLLLIYFGDQFVPSEIRHRRCVAAVFVNNQHDIKRQGQDFDTKFVFERIHSEEVDRQISWEKLHNSVVLISCSKSCGTQAQWTGGQAWQTTQCPHWSFFRSSRSLPLTLFCRLPGEVTENTFLSVSKTKSVAYCGNFWSRSLARFMRAAQFTSVSSCAWRLLKHFRCQSLQIIWDTDDRWIFVSCDISQTVLWVCGLSSWLRTKSLTDSTFSSMRAQIDDKSK